MKHALPRSAILLLAPLAAFHAAAAAGKPQPFYMHFWTDGAHAPYEGDRKLVFDFGGQPAARYNLASDLAGETNLIESPEQAGRIRQMANRYQEIRKSKRSVAKAGAFPPFFPACTNQTNKNK